MKIIIEIEGDAAEGDAVAAELVDYLIHVEGRTVRSYWVEEIDD